MEIKEIKKLEKNLMKYSCEFCNFKCSQKCDWDRHTLRAKHKVSQPGNVQEIKKLEKNFFCKECAKSFKTNAGLWKHKNRGVCATPKHNTSCQSDSKELTTNYTQNPIDKDELIIELLKQNKELLEIVKNGTTSNSHNTTTTNSHNKAFNLQFFLNETCKNAMNITDFVESIKLQLSDLIEVGELGYVEGISNIIVKNLNNLDETERPIHCTDKKRETFYVKDHGQWEKEDQERKKIRKVIKNVAFKNERLLQTYKEEHPGCNYSESKYSDEYSKLVIEAMGGPGNDEREKEEKIIRNISKATVIHN